MVHVHVNIQIFITSKNKLADRVFSGRTDASPSSWSKNPEEYTLKNNT
jgi:3-phenylpropionate/cinnamic acid dioxygenase small subunit